MAMMQVMHMETHEFSELEKVEATDDCGEASTSRPASGESGIHHSSPVTVLAGYNRKTAVLPHNEQGLTHGKHRISKKDLTCFVFVFA